MTGRNWRRDLSMIETDVCGSATVYDYEGEDVGGAQQTDAAGLAHLVDIGHLAQAPVAVPVAALGYPTPGVET